MTMITAEEARELSSNSTTLKMKNELTQIDSNIKKACDEGRFSVSCAGTLLKETIDHLEILGFKVTAHTGYDGAYYTINWKGENNNEH